MKAISLFSGVGGFDLGFERAGIETVLQAERDPHCLKVLERHWPRVRRVTDVRCVGRRSGGHHLESEPQSAEPDGTDAESERAGIDLVFGGFPCQDLSVAGKRAGLGGERSGLWYEFHRVLSELRPRWAVIENVPGLLSSNEGRDFGIILDGLGELGYGVSWAVLDARHFGVPQRRRRVFIVGCLGDQRSAQQVLSVCESCGGNPEAGRAPGERVAYSLTAGVRGTGDGHGNAWNSNYVTAAALTASAGHHGHSSPRGDGSDNLVANPLGSNATGGFRFDLDHDTYIPDVAYALATTGVRRLTPLECQRLQGFPDWWYDGLEMADSHIYRQMGNAVCVPVAEWIGHRIMEVSR